MVPPPGETWRVVVERDRRVAGEVLLRKGHMERDCLSRVSIVKSVVCSMIGYYLVLQLTVKYGGAESIDNQYSRIG